MSIYTVRSTLPCGQIISASNKRPAHLLLSPTTRLISAAFTVRVPGLLYFEVFGQSLRLIFGYRYIQFPSYFLSAAGGSGAERCRFSTENLSSDRTPRRTYDQTRRCFSVKSRTKSSGPTSKYLTATCLTWRVT